jgi:hypothetical protein
VIRFIAHILGLDSPEDPWYLWWSGAGSNLALWGFIWAVLRRNNCAEPWCWRIGRFNREDGRVCHRHQLERDGNRRPS